MPGKNFALIGAGGYIAPRHMQAIASNGHQMVAAVDVNDSVGILDRYFPECEFFTEIERFDRHLEKKRRLDPSKAVDYVSVCTPNYLHDAHIRLALRLKAHAICEKPLVISPWNLDALQELEMEYDRNIFTVLQLRHIPELIDLRDKVNNTAHERKYNIELSYITRRGPWYHASWKGQTTKSGGIAMNIGIHFFDLLLWIFGSCERSELYLREEDKMSGHLDLEKARVKWYLSTDSQDLPEGYLEKGKSAFRSLTIEGEEIEFTGFSDLHTEVYRKILAGEGYGISSARPSIDLVHSLRQQELHPYACDKIHSKLQR